MPYRVKTAALPAAARRPARKRETRATATERGYTDARHKAWRLAVLNRDHWQCKTCGRVCGEKRDAHADHVSPVVPGTDRCRNGASRYDVANGQCLCAACHGVKTTHEQATQVRSAAGGG